MLYFADVMNHCADTEQARELDLSAHTYCDYERMVLLSSQHKLVTLQTFPSRRP